MILRGRTTQFFILAAASSLAVLQSNCSREPPVTPPFTPSPTPAPSAPAPQPAPTPCGFPPPGLLEPDDGAVVSGRVKIVSELPEGPCFIAATVVFSVKSSSGSAVFSGCDNDLPARVFWDTTKTPNGRYAITAQRACGCRACAEFSSLDVTVRNR